MPQQLRRIHDFPIVCLKEFRHFVLDTRSDLHTKTIDSRFPSLETYNDILARNCHFSSNGHMVVGFVRTSTVRIEHVSVAILLHRLHQDLIGVDELSDARVQSNAMSLSTKKTHVSIEPFASYELDAVRPTCPRNEPSEHALS